MLALPPQERGRVGQTLSPYDAGTIYPPSLEGEGGGEGASMLNRTGGVRGRLFESLNSDRGSDAVDTFGRRGYTVPG